MASKLLRSTTHQILGLVRTSPNPNFPLKRLSLTPYLDLLTRHYSEVAKPVPIEPSLPVKPPIGGGSTNVEKGFNKGKTPSSSLNAAELAKFAAIAETWWDAEGPFKPLHVMNPTRLSFIRSTLCRHFRKDLHCPRPLEGLKIVDVGCGGGILSEVIEHVADPAEFCKSLAALTVSDGATVISTINRSMRSYATAIVAAEYILQWGLFTPTWIIACLVLYIVGARSYFHVFAYRFHLCSETAKRNRKLTVATTRIEEPYGNPIILAQSMCSRALMWSNGTSSLEFELGMNMKQLTILLYKEGWT
ncbi:hypothetical protein Vadar_019790 [Vaccinium darrowii]|uniref:Uncharacterized protein n=1 Tax=Vaccinium darrowii TaxID=229202 RepID=A0ACB7Z4R6_9ERIC|nr:hypothetical protein Vadar_019790 [Vaccinium darrowii]